MLNQRALERIKNIGMNGPGIAKMFELLAKHANEADAPESEAALQYKTDGTAEIGEYIPQIHLVVTRVTEENLEKWNISDSKG